tara:strand:- start:1957 stop:2115 length:159 start_codon:yes stop_codon:yes gene_type:complete
MSEKEPWRMPLGMRLIDFHKPLLSQLPIQLFVVGFTVFILIALTITLSGGIH